MSERDEFGGVKHREESGHKNGSRSSCQRLAGPEGSDARTLKGP